MEDVVDQVGAGRALRRELERTLAERGLLLRWRHVLLGAVLLVGRIGQPRFARDLPRVAGPGLAENADVVLAVAVPVADDRLVAVVAELGPQIAFVPDAVAVDVDEPLAVTEDANVGDAVAVEVARHGGSTLHAEQQPAGGVGVAPRGPAGQRPLRIFHAGLPGQTLRPGRPSIGPTLQGRPAHAADRH